MGQCCCKPHGPRWKRLTKVKAEAAAAAAAPAGPSVSQPSDPTVAQLLVDSNNNDGLTTASGLAMSQGATPASSAVHIGLPPPVLPQPVAQSQLPLPDASEVSRTGRVEEVQPAQC